MRAYWNLFIISIMISLCAKNVFAYESEHANYPQPTLNTTIMKLIDSNDVRCYGNAKCTELTDVKKLYLERFGVPIWFNNDGIATSQTNNVLNLFKKSYELGLNPTDFHVIELTNLLNSSIDGKDFLALQLQQKASFEFLMTDAYIKYSKEIQMGRINPTKIYPDWGVSRKYVDVISQFKIAINNAKLAENLVNIEPNNFQYVQLKEQLQRYLFIAEHGGWQPLDKNATVLKLGSHGDRVKQLSDRLIITGELDKKNDIYKYDQNLKNAVLLFQKEFGLKQSGIADNATVMELNIPVESRIQQIAINLDRARWLPSKLSNNFVWVNIPSYSLQVYSGNNIELAMPVIVGQNGENKTCVVTSTITSLEVNPYWGIPRRIATNEYLRKVQKDPDYLIKHKIRVYKGNTEVDQNTINWSQYTVRTFPYYLRQDSGVGNALGNLKFMFSNTCGIYLHDTPRRDLFSKTSRSMSHGCIRVGKPIDLANYLLDSNSSWTPERLSEEIKAGKRKWVSLSQPIDLYIVYMTTSVDDEGVLRFYKDIYGADKIDFKVYTKEI